MLKMKLSECQMLSFFIIAQTFVFTKFQQFLQNNLVQMCSADTPQTVHFVVQWSGLIVVSGFDVV